MTGPSARLTRRGLTAGRNGPPCRTFRALRSRRKIAAGTSYPPCEAYSGDRPYIFVSYAHADGELVFSEIRRLHEAGYRVWYDEGIDPGKDWPEHIAKAVIGCNLILMFTSPRSAASENCRNEVNLALNRKKKFLSVYLEETDLPPGLELRMGDLQSIPKFRMPDAPYRKKLYAALENLLGEDGRDVPEGEDPVAEAMAVEVGADYLAAPLKEEAVPSVRSVPEARVKTRGKGLWVGLGVMVVLSLACFFFLSREKTGPEVIPSGEDKEAKAREAIHSKYDKLVEALVANRPKEFIALTDLGSQANTPKVLLQWTALRAVVSLAKLKKDDFRIDEITFNPELTKATVRTSHRKFGNWQRDGSALFCILENGEWRWKS